MEDTFDIHAWNHKRYLNEDIFEFNSLEQDLEKEMSKYGGNPSVSINKYAGDRADNDPLKDKGFGKVTYRIKSEFPDSEWQELINTINSKKGFRVTQDSNYYDSEPGERDWYPAINFNFDLKDLNEKKDKYDFNSIKETIKIVMENPKGFSKYFPGGKTKGLTSDELSIILTKIAKDIEDNDKKY
jgi:hypothetical protein